jgi:hypothetical protein
MQTHATMKFYSLHEKKNMKQVEKGLNAISIFIMVLMKLNLSMSGRFRLISISR